MIQTIAEQLPRLRVSIDQSVPPEVAEIFLREQRTLASVTPEGIIEPGARLPDAALLDPHGHPTSLSEALAGRQGMLVFYRGAWCPYCNLALRTYQAALVDKLEARDVQLVAVLAAHASVDHAVRVWRDQLRGGVRWQRACGERDRERSQQQSERAAQAAAAQRVPPFAQRPLPPPLQAPEVELLEFYR